MLCSTETWKIPSSMEPEWWPAIPRCSVLLVMPGMNPRIPTSRKTAPTASAAYCTRVRWVVACVETMMNSLNHIVLQRLLRC